MIAMLIADNPSAERKSLLKEARWQAAKLTEDDWKWIECGTSEELLGLAEDGSKIDMMCLDLTMQTTDQMLTAAQTLRSAHPVSVKEVLSESISSYVSKFSEKDDDSFFVIETRGERELIPYDRILFYETREKKVFLNTGDMEYPFYDTLDQLEERLADRFLRCHRSYLVNKSKVNKVYLSQNLLLLNSGEEIPLSRSYKPVVKQFMMEQKR